jgi:hypothetical protein
VFYNSVRTGRTFLAATAPVVIPLGADQNGIFVCSGNLVALRADAPQVTAVEGSSLPLLDRTYERDAPRTPFLLRPDQVHLHVTFPRPVPAHVLRLPETLVGQHADDGLPDQGFDGPAALRGPALAYLYDHQVTATALDLGHVGSDEA